MKQLSYSLLMDAEALLFLITCREARLFFVKNCKRSLIPFNREKRSFIPDSQIEELSYSLRKDREASYSLLTNRKFFCKRIEKFSCSSRMDIRAILILINKWEGSLFLD